MNAGHVVSVSNRCKGLYIHVKRDLIVNGTLSMTARGANCAGQYVGIDPYNFIIELSDEDITDRYTHCIHPVGGLGNVSNSGVGVNGACGAGGSVPVTSNLRRGGNGTSFSGGSGAGGNAWYNQKWYYDYSGTSNGSDIGGIGGSAGYHSSNSYGGPGAGNPGGWANTAATKATDGTGGLLILVVDGRVIVNGSIQSNGCKGGNSYAKGSVYLSRGGAGSGGGAIHLFHRKTIVGSDKIVALGGAGGTSNTGYNGAAGLRGTVNIVKI